MNPGSLASTRRAEKTSREGSNPVVTATTIRAVSYGTSRHSVAGAPRGRPLSLTVATTLQWPAGEEIQH
jgi:hypothetical protein